MKVVICTVAIGKWYPRGVARMIDAFERVSPGYEIQAHVNCLPEGTILARENGYDYTPYCAKIRAMQNALFECNADIAILLDAAFYPIRRIDPLVHYIVKNDYYFCKNGFFVGGWASDRCLQHMEMSRETAFQVQEISSYCVGLNLKSALPLRLLENWCDWSVFETIAGPHSNAAVNPDGRNPGFVSHDRRVQGHRHDQTVLSILAHRLGMDKLCERPLYTAYAGHETEETVLVNRGI